MKTIYLPKRVFSGGDFKTGFGVVTEGGLVVETGPAEALRQKYPDASCEDWSGLVMLPGTVNAHNHSFQILLRGIAADRPFLEWRDRALYRYSPRLRPEDVYAGALFAFGEMLRCGVTTVCDFFYVHNDGLDDDEAVIRAAHDLGIRLVLARAMYDWEGAPAGYRETVDTACNNVRTLAARYHGGDGMVSILPAPHSLHAASPEMIRAGHALAKEMGTVFHIHVAEEPFEVEQVQKEYGLRTIETLDRFGVVDRSMVMIHGVWLSEKEIDTYAAAGGMLAYCPSSNMFLADGVTDIRRMLRKGVTIGLGSDGACSNNRVSIFEEMRMASLLQKAAKLDSLCVSCRQAFAMGTENGAALLNLPIGKIEAGRRADFVGVAEDDFSMQPVTGGGEQLLPNVVYSMQPYAIRRVVVDGVLRMEDGRILGVGGEEIIKKVKETMRRLES